MRLLSLFLFGVAALLSCGGSTEPPAPEPPTCSIWACAANVGCRRLTIPCPDAGSGPHN